MLPKKSKSAQLDGVSAIFDAAQSSRNASRRCASKSQKNTAPPLANSGQLCAKPSTLALSKGHKYSYAALALRTLLL
jgi:hypothetical protein